MTQQAGRPGSRVEPLQASQELPFDPKLVETVAAHFAAEAERASDRHGRGAVANLLVTASSIALLVACHTHHLPLPREGFLPNTFGALVIAGWFVFQASALAHFLGGNQTRHFAALVVLDEFLRFVLFAVLVYYAGTAFLVLAMFTYFAWPGPNSWRARWTLGAFAVTQGALVTFLLRSFAPVDAVMVLLAAIITWICYRAVGDSRTRTVRVRADEFLLQAYLQRAALDGDGERIAREMHDGFGADAMALLLRLRRTAEETGSEEHAVLRDRAQQVLDEVRTVVWSLRSNQGTVGELGKLVGVMCRRESQDAAYIAPGPDVASCTVDPVSALQAVRKAREVLRCLARHHGKNLEIELGSPRDFSSAQGEPPNGEGALEGLDPVPMELRLHGGIPLATQPCKAELTALLAHDARVTWDATETGMNVTVLLPLCAKSTRRSRWSLSEAELEDALALRERE